MLAIKLQRIGKKHQPSYRLVVAEKRSKMAAPPVEDLGSYSTLTKKTAINQERIAYWLGVGARPTVTAHNLLVKNGLLKSAPIAVKMKKPEPVARKEESVSPTAASKTPAEPDVAAEAAA